MSQTAAEPAMSIAETLRAWRRRFEANRASIAERLDERFCRIWEFYLALSEAAFRHGGHFVFQMQLAKRRDTAGIHLPPPPPAHERNSR